MVVMLVIGKYTTFYHTINQIKDRNECGIFRCANNIYSFRRISPIFHIYMILNMLSYIVTCCRHQIKYRIRSILRDVLLPPCMTKTMVTRTRRALCHMLSRMTTIVNGGKWRYNVYIYRYFNVIEDRKIC